MKKLNMKKLNQFYSNANTPREITNLVEQAVHNFVHEDVKNPQCIAILNDLGLLMDA